MHHFFDPSIKPIVHTDLSGNILYVRTYGLSFYGYPDIILNRDFEGFEDIFYSIIDRIFSLDFDINGTWDYNGRMFKLHLDNGLASIIFPDMTNVRILTIRNPISGETAKYKSKGLKSLFDHPEIEVSGDLIHGKEILAYLIKQIETGLIYDEDCLILYDDLSYEINCKSDRFGNKTLELSTTILKEEKIQIISQGSYLKRIK
ncbi:hypothetical protein P4K96_25140 [Bacillus cereus]|nr:hypothetical protein [Bacillus cereus]